MLPAKFIQHRLSFTTAEFVNINVGIRVSRLTDCTSEAGVVMKEPLIIMMITDYLADI